MSITKIKASNITDGSITASKLANTYALSTDSISAGTYANTAIANASSASLYANTGITIAQASFNAANNVMPQIQPAFDAANSASLYANTGIANVASASAYANTGINNAASASLYANTKVSKSGDTITGPIIISNTGSGALQVAGTVTISQDLNVTGNIFISGTATTISSNNLTLSDPLIYLAVGNVANTADIGIVGHVTNGHYYHTGMARDHLDGTWKFFSNVHTEPTTTINFAEANTVYDVIQVGGVISPTALINGRELGAYTQASFNKANTSVTSVSGTGTVNGLTLSGTVTSSGSLTLGGTLALGSLNTLGTAAGLSGTPNITVGSVSGTTGSFSGQLNSVGMASNNIDAAGFAYRVVASAVGTQAIVQWVNNAQNAQWTSLVGTNGNLQCTSSFSSLGIAATGNITASGDIYSAYSDIRLKTVLGTIENPIEKIRAIETFYYEPNELAIEKGAVIGRKVGVSAQSVEEIMPEVIGQSGIDCDYLTVQYERLVPLLIEAIKKQQDQIDILNKKLGL